MLQKRNNALLAMSAWVMTWSSIAFGAGEENLVDLFLKDELSLIHTLISTGFLIAAFLKLVDSWESIFQGDGILAKVAPIAALIALAVYWQALLRSVGSIFT